MFLSSTTIVILLNGLIIDPALPFALGLHLFILKLLPTKTSFIKSLSMSSCLLFSAFATAAFKTFKTVPDILLEENLSQISFIWTLLKFF